MQEIEDLHEEKIRFDCNQQEQGIGSEEGLNFGIGTEEDSGFGFDFETGNINFVSSADYTSIYNNIVCLDDQTPWEFYGIGVWCFA